MSTPNLYLYDHPVSSYAQKVRIALRLKNLPFKAETPPKLGTGVVSDDFRDANPRTEVPALVIDNDLKIFDSTAILMYLEDEFPEPHPLLPATSRERAEARMIEEMCDTHYEAVNWAFGEVRAFKRAEGVEADRLVGNIQAQTVQIQQWLGEKLGDRQFFNGDVPGYADICVAPIVDRSVKYGFEIEGANLKAWHKRIEMVPAFAETLAEMGDALKGMMSLGTSMFPPHGGHRREYRDHRLEWMLKNGAYGIVAKGLQDDTIRFSSWPSAT